MYPQENVQRTYRVRTIYSAGYATEEIFFVHPISDTPQRCTSCFAVPSKSLRSISPRSRVSVGGRCRVFIRHQWLINRWKPNGGFLLKIGYGRVSSLDQNLDPKSQLSALKAAKKSTANRRRAIEMRTARARQSHRCLADEGRPGAGLTTPSGRGILALLSGLAEEERHRIMKRANEGRVAAVKRGTKMGRTPKLDDHQQKEALKRIKAGESLRIIAKSYRVHHSTISRLPGRP